MRKTLLASAALLGIAIAMPAFAADMTPEQYLMQARTAVHNHDTYGALIAVNNAENELLRAGAADQSRSTRDVGPPAVVRQMGKAREAIQNQNWTQADIELNDAMAHPSASTAANPLAGSSGNGSVGAAQK